MLRNYQLMAIQAIENNKSKNVLLQMPTGSGKTFTFCEAAKRHFAENRTKVLILVHRTELLQQAYNSLGERTFKIEKGIKQIPHDFDFYVGMVETLSRRLALLPEFGLVIIDECHIGNFKKTPFFHKAHTKVIGVTATPVAETPLSLHYNDMIMPISVSELIQNNYLVNCEVFGFASDLVSKQNFKTIRGEFDEKQMEEFYSSEKMVKNVIEAYWKKLSGQKTLIFNVNINHNEAVYLAFKKEGLNVYQITGETPDWERKEVLKRFKTESDAIICNVGVLTTGFDEPSVKAIVLNRATKSLALYLQMIGRGSRLFESKEKFTVIDLGKNTTRHGFYDDFFDWKTFFLHGTKKEKSNKESAMPIKECPSCGFTLHTRIVECPNCNHSFEEERKKQMKQEKEQELFLLTRKNPIKIPSQKLYELAAERGWKPYAVLHRIAAHIVDYEIKYEPIVTRDYSNSKGIEELDIWCKKYNIKNNKWHKDLIINHIKTKYEKEKGIQDSAGNSDLVSEQQSEF